MRQKIRFTIFDLYHQNKTNRNNFCVPVAVIDEKIANTIFQVNIINLTWIEKTCNDAHNILAIYDIFPIPFLTASKMEGHYY